MERTVGRSLQRRFLKQQHLFLKQQPFVPDKPRRPSAEPALFWREKSWVPWRNGPRKPKKDWETKVRKKLGKPSTQSFGRRKPSAAKTRSEDPKRMGDLNESKKLLGGSPPHNISRGKRDLPQPQKTREDWETNVKKSRVGTLPQNLFGKQIFCKKPPQKTRTDCDCEANLKKRSGNQEPDVKKSRGNLPQNLSRSEWICPQAGPEISGRQI